MTKRRREMFALVEACDGSGLSRKEFCSRHGVGVSTFSWWRSEYRRCRRVKEGADNASPSFVAVAGSAATQSVEYRYSDGATVRIPMSLGAAQVGSIVRELRGAACSV